MNPYAPPATSPVEEQALPAAGPVVLARRSTRLIGAVIDTVAIVAVGTAVSHTWAETTGTPRTVVSATICFVVVQIVNWFLLATRSQTIGKMVVGTKILRADGRPAGFVQTVVRRIWPMTALTFLQLAFPQIKLAVSLVSLIDAGLIWWKDENRTLHDRIAGTIVIDVKATEAHLLRPRT